MHLVQWTWPFVDTFVWCSIQYIDVVKMPHIFVTTPSLVTVSSVYDFCLTTDNSDISIKCQQACLMDDITT